MVFKRLFNWIKEQIESQFDSSKKMPPYTFADFKNSYIHIGRRPFLDLYIVGTDLSYRLSKTFSYETTPDMEVAEAVRSNEDIMTRDYSSNVFCDGGVMWNYPINLFDSTTFKEHGMSGVNYGTLGGRFINKTKYYHINNFLDFVKNLYFSQLRIQQNFFNHSPQDIIRSIQIDIGDVSPIDFNISTGDETYNFLYAQGYKAAKNYFQNRMY